MGIAAVELFHEIPANMVNDWINVCVLNACSHSALINEARQIFQNIPKDKRTEKIYTAMARESSNIFHLNRLFCFLFFY